MYYRSAMSVKGLLSRLTRDLPMGVLSVRSSVSWDQLTVSCSDFVNVTLAQSSKHILKKSLCSNVWFEIYHVKVLQNGAYDHN